MHTKLQNARHILFCLRFSTPVHLYNNAPPSLDILFFISEIISILPCVYTKYTNVLTYPQTSTLTGKNTLKYIMILYVRKFMFWINSLHTYMIQNNSCTHAKDITIPTMKRTMILLQWHWIFLTLPFPTFNCVSKKLFA